MSGCDYLPNKRGIGFKSLMTAFQSKAPKKAIRQKLVKRCGGEREAEEYLAEVARTMTGFKHPLVVNGAYQLVYMNGDKVGSREELVWFSGERFENVERFVQGKLDLRTLEPRKPVDVDFKRLSSYFNFIPNVSSGRLNNLCARLVTSDNFDTLSCSEPSENRESGHGTPLRKRVKRELLSKQN